MNRDKINSIKEKYKKGTTIRLKKMEGESQMQEGLKGTVSFVDDIGQIHVNWENRSTLALNIEVDEFDVVS